MTETTATLGIIGGTGALELFSALGSVQMTTPFGAPSARPEKIALAGREAWFIARHGRPHKIPPHRVNYRANLWALRELGVTRVVAVNAVGGIDPALQAGDLVVPDQVIDYTWGREHTFSDGPSAPLKHVEFAAPFASRTRDALLAAARRLEVGVRDGGVYGATQGPRLETAAEIRRMARDGCHLVGMTGMPEAALARELGLDYACICIVSNAAAGLSDEPISEEDIHHALESAMGTVTRVLETLTIPA